MSFNEKSSEDQEMILLHANQYFTRITDVLRFLVYTRGVENMKHIIPDPFVLIDIYGRTHLAIQRHGGKYDGKRYTLDTTDARERLATDIPMAEIEDFRWALIQLDEPQNLQEFIMMLDRQTADSPKPSP